ncbi:FdhF/YdeP family oxidoreductase [Dyella sp.]|uniref:FdhF/YdeP family oxidoreductase n=1 Tax=Dyella sp. TaxID=1869338 RepID=UPI002ED3E86F
MSNETKIQGIAPYDGAAGGWGALRAVAKALAGQMAIGRETSALRRVNQPHGFDCPGCAWPDPKDTSSFEFCENGAKAVSWEATAKRVTPEFFAANPVKSLWNLSDYALENLGRITHPMAYDAATDTYRVVAWEEAFRRIGESLRALPRPQMAEFYTSGRASNEVAFLYQVFVREFGANNFPDCSNMCHEATSVGLPQSIGVGKGTVLLEDFDHCDAVFCIGHNPGTNHPRMLATLREVAKRNVPIVAINPLPERGLERFTSPQHAAEMITNASTQLATTYYQVKCGGDLAMLKGMMKWLFDADTRAQAQGDPAIIDHAFIAEHTAGIEALRQDIANTSWDDIELRSGLSREDIENAAQIYARARKVIVCYGMGVTQHAHGTENVQQIANLLMLRGNIGREGAGICPLRGHSNVQGNRTVGITEKPDDALVAGIERAFGFRFSKEHGHDAVGAIRAIRDGQSRVMISLGGNLAVAMPDPVATFDAMRKLDMAVHITTKLNRSHLLIGKDSIILPCLGRTELDEQAEGVQSITVEDSMSMVHASQGSLQPASEHLRSEPWIIAGIAKATLPQTKVAWDWLVADYNRIRDKIEEVYPAFRDYNKRVSEPGGFRLPVAASQRKWNTPDGKAQFLVARGLDEDPLTEVPHLKLTTVRSHDQYNTTIYSLNDRYRGINGRRDVIFVHPDDLAAAGLGHGDRIDVEVQGAHANDSEGNLRAVRGFVAVSYPIAQGTVAMYYPEGNCLVGLDSHDPASGTPSYKSVPVALRASGDARRG